MNIAVVKVALVALSLVLVSSSGYAAQKEDGVRGQSEQQRVSYETVKGKAVHQEARKECCKPNSVDYDDDLDESIVSRFSFKELQQRYQE